MKMSFIVIILCLAHGIVSAQTGRCCCCDFRNKGQAEFNANRFELAIKDWEKAKECSDADQCNDLNNLISLAKSRIKSRDAAVVKERQLQQAAEEKADNDAFEIAVAANTRAAYAAYLKKFPAGRHAAEAKKMMPPLKGSTVEAPDNFIRIPGGKFEMGDVMGDKENSTETIHQVTVSPFYMAPYEITFDEYDRYCEDTNTSKPNDNGWGRGNLPVISVSWYNAIAYCNWLSIKKGLKPVYNIDKNIKDPNNSNKDDALKWTITADWSATGYRLPTEAEWEYAARQCGQKLRFGNGKDIADPKEINFNDSTNHKKSYSLAFDVYRKKSSPIGSFKPNSLGLFDMSGNVFEWCWDWYGNYQTTEQTDPRGSSSGSFRVLKGGSWHSTPSITRVSSRLAEAAHKSFSNVGIRLVRSAN